MPYKDDVRRLRPDAWPWSVTLQTRFVDMDVNRHLNNTAIARLCEEGRVRFHWHIRSTFPEAGHPHFLVAHVGVDYLTEGFYPRDVTVRLAVVDVGRSSYRIAQGLFQRGKDDTEKAFALSETVMVHRGDDMRPAPMPEPLRAALGSFALAG